MNTSDYIIRSEYINKIKPFIGQNLIKVLVGQRRVGKSYLLLQLVDTINDKDEKANIIQIDKEDYEFHFIANYADLIEYVESKSKAGSNNYVFIDEIQDIKEFERALRHLIKKNDTDIICTGSNANLLSGDLATLLSRRSVEFKIYSLSYEEFLRFHSFDDTDANLLKYMRWGGLPFLRNLSKQEEVISEYLKNIYATIIYKELISRFNIRNTIFLENLINYLAENVGNIISAYKISDYLKSQQIKLSNQIVLNYLHYLEQSYLIHKVKRKKISGKKVFEIHEKYYFEDWGILNSVIGFKNIDLSRIIENVVYHHLVIRGYKITIGILGKKEIDFVAERNGLITYIQTSYILADKKIREREFGNLLEIQDNYPKIVVSLDDFAPENIKGVQHYPLRKFLMEFQ